MRSRQDASTVVQPVERPAGRPVLFIHRKLEFSGFGYESAAKILMKPNDE
jgi:hypothetical protein